MGAYNPKTNVMFMPLSNACIDETARTDREAAPQFVYNVDANTKFASGKTNVGRIDAIGFAVAGGIAAYLDMTRLTPDDEADLAAWLADESMEKAVHDAKGPLLGLWAQGYDLLARPLESR